MFDDEFDEQLDNPNVYKLDSYNNTFLIDNMYFFDDIVAYEDDEVIVIQSVDYDDEDNEDSYFYLN